MAAAAAGPSGEAVPVDEDAAELQFPKEFELPDTKTLLISEVNILLDHRKQQVRLKCYKIKLCLNKILVSDDLSSLI